MTGLSISDILSDRAKLVRVFQIAFWASLVFLGIGYAMILMDLLG